MESRYDLHIHSCLSPCADDDMTVNNIANMAALCGIGIAALTDHNSLKNCPAFFTACGRAGVVPVAGVELCTREEVHVLCLFPSLKAGMEFDRHIEPLLPGFVNNPTLFGRQLVLDGDDRIVCEEEKLLISACDVGIAELPGMLRPFGGTAIPAHIDRPGNGLISHMGFIPPEFEFTCYEIKDYAALRDLTKKNPVLSRVRIISDSDAHALSDLAMKEHGRLDLAEMSAEALLDLLSSKL